MLFVVHWCLSLVFATLLHRNQFVFLRALEDPEKRLWWAILRVDESRPPVSVRCLGEEVIIHEKLGLGLPLDELEFLKCDGLLILQVSVDTLNHALKLGHRAAESWVQHPVCQKLLAVKETNNNNQNMFEFTHKRITMQSLWHKCMHMSCCFISAPKHIYMPSCVSHSYTSRSHFVSGHKYSVWTYRTYRTLSHFGVLCVLWRCMYCYWD